MKLRKRNSNVILFQIPVLNNAVHILFIFVCPRYTVFKFMNAPVVEVQLANFITIQNAFFNSSLQWIIGFLSFMAPGIRMDLRAAYKPLHVFWGLAIFFGAVATALMGITEKVIFS